MTEGQAAAAALEARGGQIPREFPRVVLETLGIPLSSAEPIGFVARAWTGEGWGEQTLLGALATGMGPGGQGPGVVTASAARYVRRLNLPVISQLVVASLLRGSGFQGMIFFLLDAESKPTALTTTPLGGALLAIMEGAEGRVWNPRSALLESWTAGLVISQWPWPESGVQKVAEYSVPVIVGNHFTPALAGDGVVGWATGWDHGLGKACSRASRVAKEITPLLPGVQWRVGAHADLLHRWHLLVDGGMEVELG